MKQIYEKAFTLQIYQANYCGGNKQFLLIPKRLPS